MATEPEEGEKAGPVIRPFAEFLIEHQQGRIAVELGEKLHELVEACKAHDKQGTLSLKITVVPMKDAMDTLIVSADVKASIPEAKVKGSVYFSDADGNLVRTNPQQPGLPLREVGGPKIEADPIDVESREVAK